MKGFGIYVQNDLLEPKHHRNMGSAIWLYLWCLDKMTSINEDGVGKVLGGKPIKLQDIEGDLDISARTYTRYLKALEESGYISATRTPYGYVIKVTKAKKQFGKRYAKNDERYAKNVREIRQSGRNKEDNTKTVQDTISETSSPHLKSNKKDMPWNRQSDDLEEGVVDYDSGELTEIKKPQTKKYPNAPIVRKIFQSVLGKNPANWKLNKNQLLACENLYTERGLVAIENALRYFKENKEAEYIPLISSPFDLDSKWAKLANHKTKQT